MQFKKGDTVEVKGWMVTGMGAVAKDCLEYEDTALVAFKGVERPVWVPTDNLESISPKAESTVLQVWMNGTLESHKPCSRTIALVAIAVAETQERAADLLNAELEFRRLEGRVKPEDMILVVSDLEHAKIFYSDEY